MKLLPALTTAMFAMGLSVHAEEQAPAGAAEKIAAVLPDKAFAKPAKPRKLLVFAKTNGFRHASIAFSAGRITCGSGQTAKQSMQSLQASRAGSLTRASENLPIRL